MTTSEQPRNPAPARRLLHPAGRGTKPDRMAFAVQTAVPDWTFRVAGHRWIATDGRRRVVIHAPAGIEQWNVQGFDGTGTCLELWMPYAAPSGPHTFDGMIAALRGVGVLPAPGESAYFTVANSPKQARPQWRVTQPLLDVLAALVDTRDELHGWAIIKATGRSGPTVYKVLERLTAMEWITARWGPLVDENPGRPRRRYYRLTSEGRERSQKLLADRRPIR